MVPFVVLLCKKFIFVRCCPKPAMFFFPIRNVCSCGWMGQASDELKKKKKTENHAHQSRSPHISSELVSRRQACCMLAKQARGSHQQPLFCSSSAGERKNGEANASFRKKSRKRSAFQKKKEERNKRHAVNPAYFHTVNSHWQLHTVSF